MVVMCGDLIMAGRIRGTVSFASPSCYGEFLCVHAKIFITVGNGVSARMQDLVRPDVDGLTMPRLHIPANHAFRVCMRIDALCEICMCM